MCNFLYRLVKKTIFAVMPLFIVSVLSVGASRSSAGLTWQDEVIQKFYSMRSLAIQAKALEDHIEDLNDILTEKKGYNPMFVEKYRRYQSENSLHEVDAQYSSIFDDLNVQLSANKHLGDCDRQSAYSLLTAYGAIYRVRNLELYRSEFNPLNFKSKMDFLKGALIGQEVHSPDCH